MGISRSELREKAMVILYQIEIYKKSSIAYEVDDIIKENLEIDNDFVKNIVYGVVTDYDKLVSEINTYMNEWSIDRIDKTGASILLSAVYELKNMDTPSVVVVNEAIELAKKYSDDSVRKIINAVLDRMIKE